jgi:putative oxidoreductase
MFKQCCGGLLRPHAHLASLVLRLGLAAVFIVNGYVKVSVQMGRGWDNNLPETTQMVVAWGELVCGVALLLGLLSRLAAIGLIVMQWGAISLYTWRYDFINIEYNPHDRHRIAPGSQFNFALIVMCLAVVLLGSGLVSVDHLLFRKRKVQKPAA